MAPAAWVLRFVFFQIACQLALLLEAFSHYRAPIRMMSFGASLFLIFWLSGRGRLHPAARMVPVILGILGLGLLNPATNSLLAGAAQIALYAAILSPLYWMGHIRMDVACFRRVILTLWAFQTLSAAFGILQVYYPGRFEPALSQALDADYREALMITLPNGARVYRPMGLTDTPGGAATAGFYATLLAFGLVMTERRWLLRLLCLASMAMGLFCIYLSQVRVNLVLTAVCVLVYAVMLMWRGDFARLSWTIIIAYLVAMASFAWAVSVGNKVVTERLNTLVEDRPGEVYHKNRGIFLRHAFEDVLPNYPLGMGLGRWGMINQYFGHEDVLWVEIQWQAWAIDGGIPLMASYVVAVLTASFVALRIALRRSPRDLGLWGALIVAYDVGALALTFSYAIFIGQLGLDFWLLNAALFAASTQAVDQPRLSRPAG